MTVVLPGVEAPLGKASSARACPHCPLSWAQIVRLDQHLDTWRPRVHGTQLKALLNCRLPEQPEEFAAAEQAVASVKWALRVSSRVQRALLPCLGAPAALAAAARAQRGRSTARASAPWPTRALRLPSLSRTCGPAVRHVAGELRG